MCALHQLQPKDVGETRWGLTLGADKQNIAILGSILQDTWTAAAELRIRGPAL
jgi:hypothetical protein